MDISNSKLVLKAAFEASDILNRALESLRASVPDRKIQLSFGKVLGEILVELINPMGELHPSLKPGTIAEWNALARDVGARKEEELPT
jgi:hypothetical protein